MSITAIALASAMLAAPVAAPRGGAPRDAARVPAGVNTNALLELSAFGEVIFLPERNRNPFSAVIFSHGNQSCAKVKHKMLDVAGYPKLWRHIEGETVIRSRTPTKTRYALHLDLPLAPLLEGLVEDVGPKSVKFHDVETGGSFTWTMRDVKKRCHLRYVLYQPKGKESPFVSLLRKVEDGVGDAAELSAALATARGYASNTSRRQPELISDRAKSTLSVLAGRGIALRVLRHPGGNVGILGKRRVALEPDAVLKKIRNRNYAARQADFLADVEPEDGGLEWHVRYFNGRVNFVTKATESGSVDAVDGLVIHEKVTGGDIDTGHWTWRVTKVEGGTDVELLVDLDVTKGSYVLSSLTSADTTIRDAARFQLVFSFLGDLIGGQPLPASNQQVATAP